MLRELTIENYRCFEKLHVKDLAQVNLIVGKNNVGKTSFLEAVYLYVSKADPKALLEILSAREQTYEQLLQGGDSPTTHHYQVGDLFHVDRHTQKSQDYFLIESDLKLRADVHHLSLVFQFGNALIDFSQPTPLQPSNSADWRLVSLGLEGNLSDSQPIILSQSFLHDHIDQSKIAAEKSKYAYCLIENRGLGFTALRRFWDEVNLTPEEEDVVKAMQLLEPRIQRIGLVSRPNSINAIKLRLLDEANPISLSRLGDGMRRLFGIAMALSVSKSGYLIIDEIDTGLHYNAQIDMWRLVLETAKRLNVQVFATTHSWDCIAAFQSALEEMEDPTIGKLIRLDARGEKLRAVEYKAEELEIAVSHGIEVR
jgi:AAA domain, putative AbiEii toxin, Type IV TA system/AAA domain